MTTEEIRRALAKQYGAAPKALIVGSPVAIRQSRGMNKTETRRSVELKALKRAGEIRRWMFEGFTLKLAGGLRYTPDFWVEQADGVMRFEETKGHWRDDARAKIKMAATAFPSFRFYGYTVRPAKNGGGWTVEEFRP